MGEIMSVIMKFSFLNKFLFLLILVTNVTAILADDLDSVKISDTELEKLKQFAQVAYSTLPTVCNTYKISIKCLQNNIPGDFVECGVAAGTQIGAMGYACQLFKSNKKIHGFDSFEGIPLAGPNDADQPGIGAITHNVHVENFDKLLISSGITVHSLENVKNNIVRWNLDPNAFLFYKGWFQHVLPVAHAQISQISFLRLDGDLYESTVVCLEYLYPKISKGGYIVIDDYALPGCRKAIDQYLEKHNLHPQIITIAGGNGPVYWIV